MAILKPTNISPNNISKDATNDIIVSWNNLGDRQYYYQLVLYNNSDSTLVYDTGKVSSLNSFHIIPANTLTNGITYKYQITVWNQVDQYATSDWIIFKCSSTPVCSFTNLVSNDEILNSSYLFQGQYSQAEGVPIKSWTMILYDSLDTVISVSPETFSEIIEYEFSGLYNETDYYVELQVRSQDDLLATTGKIPFHVRYEVPSSAINLEAENVAEKAAVRLQWKVIQIIGEVIDGTISFIDGEKIDLTNGTIVFQDGMPNFREFDLKLWLNWTDLKNTVQTYQVETCLGTINWNVKDNKTEILRLKSPLGDIWVEWVYEDDKSGRIHLWKNMYDIKYHIYSDLMSPTNDDEIYIGINYDGNLCDLSIKYITHYSEEITVNTTIVSLPSDCVEGQISAVVKGQTISQFVKNGNFADGSTGWYMTASTLSVSNNTLSITGDGTNQVVRAGQLTSIKPEINSKIFVRAILTVKNSDANDIYLRLRDGVSGSVVLELRQNAPTINTRYILYGICTISSELSNNLAVLLDTIYLDSTTANGKTTEAQEVMAIDLTSHGLDSLTADECNERFPHWLQYGVNSTNSVTVVIQDPEGNETGRWEPDPSLFPLRSLPNGTKDEISADGKKVQRVSDEVVLDGSLNWMYDSEGTSTVDGIDYHLIKLSISNIPNCVDQRYTLDGQKSRMIDSTGKDLPLNESTSGIEYGHQYSIWVSTLYYLYLALPNNLTGWASGYTPSVAEIQSYMDSNPYTLIYQLASPIETQFNPANLIAQPNGTIILDVDGAVPILTYKYPLYIAS